MTQNLSSILKDDVDGPVYLSILSAIIACLTLMFYIGATNRIQEIENILNKKNTTIVDLHEKLEKLTDEYTKMDSDHVDDYNALVETVNKEHSEKVRLQQLNENLRQDLIQYKTFHKEVTAQCEEYEKRIHRLESRLKRMEPRYEEI